MLFEQKNNRKSQKSYDTYIHLFMMTLPSEESDNVSFVRGRKVTDKKIITQSYVP